MTPEKRREQRRNEDASFRTTASHDNEVLKQRIKALESLLAEAGMELLAFVCGCDLALNGWDISKAKLIVSKVDAILPKTEEVK